MADIHQPHDRLFRAVFSDASEAASLLRNALPDTIRSSFDLRQAQVDDPEPARRHLHRRGVAR